MNDAHATANVHSVGPDSVRSTEILGELERVGAEINRAAELVTTLEARLAGVLAPDNEPSLEKVPMDTDMRTPIGATLNTANVQLGALQRHVQRLLNRIEL